MKRLPGATQADLDRLATEQPNRVSAGLDMKSAFDVVRIMNAEDAKVATAVRRALPQIARAIDLITNGLERGGQADLRGSWDQWPYRGTRRGRVPSHL